MPFFEELAQEHRQNMTGVKFCTIDVEENPLIQEHFRLFNLPVVMFFYRGLEDQQGFGFVTGKEQAAGELKMAQRKACDVEQRIRRSAAQNNID